MRLLKRILIALSLLIIVAAAIGGTVGWWLSVPISDADLTRIAANPQFEDGRFRNDEKQAGYDFTWSSAKRQFFGEEQREPLDEMPVVQISPELLERTPAPGARLAWLGHSGVMVEIDGVRILTDPVFAERASPFGFAGPKRFHPSPIQLKELQGIDAVVISHNHYDHLDKETILHLAPKNTKFFVPLGNGGLLRSWGIAGTQINEFEWGDSATIRGVTIHSTPSRHYSNRGLLDYKKTLWSSWTIIGPQHRVFFSGDSGYTKSFAETGSRFGPFDATIIKVGSYGPGQAWQDIHMVPEDSIRTHKDLQGRAMLPVHWGTFNLGMHEWKEPIVRAQNSAKQNGVDLFTPQIGEWVELDGSFISSNWWEAVR